MLMLMVGRTGMPSLCCVFFGLVHEDINLDLGFRGMVGGMLSLCCGGWLRAIREGRKSLCSSSGLRISPDPHN